ncbi:MAG: hypothetical protein HQL41_14645 [Alphaproteobacteria bacterium]|nr:hypothetical protein [Alphaproteobacteria bacterium]
MKMKSMLSLAVISFLTASATYGVAEARDGNIPGSVVNGIFGAVADSAKSNPKDGQDAAADMFGKIFGGVVGAKFGKDAGKAVEALVGAGMQNRGTPQVGSSLDAADRVAFEQAVVRAFTYGQAGQAMSWSNPQSGVSALIVPQESKTEARKFAVLMDKRLSPVPQVALIGETYKAKKSTSVRAFPAANAEVLSRLKLGESFTAVGKIYGADWIVVGNGRRTLGYVVGGTVEKSATDHLASNATIRQPISVDAIEKRRAEDFDGGNFISHEMPALAPCRRIDVVLTTSANTERSALSACKGPDGGWEMADVVTSSNQSNQVMPPSLSATRE